MSRSARLSAAAASVLLAVAVTACGKKGPPLPPLVRIPAAPADVVASRRGQAVDLQFTLPSANADGSKPANLQRVEVYALSGTAPASEDDVLRSGVRVGAVDVKAPRDPNQTVDADDPDADIEALEGPGLDQGATARVRELLTTAMLGPGEGVRTYVAVSINTRGRRATTSSPVAVPLAPAPAAPPAPEITYTEQAVTVSWQPEPAGGDLAYHVYDVSPPPPSGGDGSAPSPGDGAPELRLSEAPLAEGPFVDKRITWNVERCYVVRAVRSIGERTVEGDASARTCTVLNDTFPPAPPTGVTAVASEGAINLIWTPGGESDLAGYRVLRVTLPADAMQPVTSDLVTSSTFTDAVQAGVRYAYAVQAVDTAGNVSQPSARVEETAR